MSSGPDDPIGSETDQQPSSTTLGATDQSEPVSADSERATADESSSIESDGVDGGDRSNAKQSSPMRALLVNLLLGIGLAVVINWPYQQASVSASFALNSPVDLPMSDMKLPRVGGWPYRYVVSFSERGDLPAASVFSGRALFYNVGIALIPIILFSVYAYRRTLLGRGVRKKRNVTIGDLLLITLVLAGGFGLWQKVSSDDEAERKLAAKIRSAGGNTSMQAWVPEIFDDYLPAALTNKLRRICAVKIESPPDELLGELVRIPNLSSLRIGGGQYDLRTLDGLANRPMIHDLRVAGRVLDARSLQVIASLPRLQTLNLMRTNVDANSIQLLDNIAGLEGLNLIHSDVKLAELGKPGWSSSIQELHLPHPQQGDSDSLMIEGWPKLQKLMINEYDSTTNSTPMVVVLKDLPELQSLGIDGFQKFDLTLDNLPMLSGFEAQYFEWRLRIPNGGTVPGVAWVSRLIAKDIPSVEELRFYMPDLKEFKLTGAPKLKGLFVGAFRRTVSAAPYEPDVPREAATALIKGLGESDGPVLADLDALPLQNVDLSPLKNNKGLKELMLSQSNTNFQQWKQLEGMTWLERLDVKNNQIDSEAINWLLDHFPNLKHFACFQQATPGYTPGGFDWNQVDLAKLEIRDRPNLKTLDLGDLSTEYFEDVRIVNSPQLDLPLRLGYLSNLEITGSPGVTGLSVESYFPDGAKLQGLRDLEFLAVGGPNVNDAVLDAIQECQALATLTLAYPSVSAEALKKLQFRNLGVLSMPGAAVNDEVVQAWPDMPILSYIDLTDTQITGKSLKKLLASRQVTKLRVNNCPIAKTDLVILGGQSTLQEVGLAGIGCDAPTMKAIFEAARSLRLNLSNTTVDPATMNELLAGASSLTYLVLRNCKLDSKKLLQLAATNPQLVFDVTDSNITTSALTTLLSAQRIVDVNEYEERVAMQAMMRAMQRGGGQPSRPPALINAPGFDPKLAANQAVPVQATPTGGTGGGVISGMLRQFFSFGSSSHNEDTEAEPDTLDAIDSDIFGEEKTPEDLGDPTREDKE